MRIDIPEAVSFILSQLNKHGYEAFAVGGCVRDTILGRVPGDWDITTSAKPLEVKEIFRHTVDTGLQHGTVTVLIDHEGYEVTTYRVDGEYADGRHPKQVSFTADLKEDLKRRDFTINAMAYHPDLGIVDEFTGIEDLEQKIIRCVGNPMERFTEDALRILRAVRFSAQLDFEIEEGTRRALAEIAPNLKNVSCERIAVELNKTLTSAHPEKLMIAHEAGMTEYMAKDFGEIFDGRGNGTAAVSHNLRCMAALEPKKYLRLAAFLSHMDDAYVKLILKQLKLDNDTIKNASSLVKYYNEELPHTDFEIRVLMSKVSEEIFEDLLNMICALRSEDEEALSEVSHIRSRSELIRRNGDCISMKKLAVTGRDLIEAGVQKGPAFGLLMDKLFMEVLEHPENNDREVLMRIVRGSIQA